VEDAKGAEEESDGRTSLTRIWRIGGSEGIRVGLWSLWQWKNGRDL